MDLSRSFGSRAKEAGRAISRVLQKRQIPATEKRLQYEMAKSDYLANLDQDGMLSRLKASLARLSHDKRI